ncbi:MAG: hypothetical protein ACREL6_09415 [Gemmatimonadales bacterium]
MIRKAIAVALMLLASMVSISRAQTAEARRGFFITGSVSVGGAREMCDGCVSPQLPGFDGLGLQLGIAHSLGRSFRGGIEGTWWNGSNQGVDRRLALVSAIIGWQPFAAAGLFVNGGIGYSDYREESSTGNIQQARGIGLQAGLSYEIAIIERLRVVPFARFLRSTGTSTSLNGQPAGDIVSIRPGLFHAGVGVRWGPF